MQTISFFFNLFSISVNDNKSMNKSSSYIYIYMKEPIIMIEIITIEYASQELHSLCALTLKSVI